MEIGEQTLENPKYYEMTEELVETTLEEDSHKRKPTWEREIIWEAESYGALEGIHRDRKRENPYNSYISLLCDIIEREPSTYEDHR